mmetsp:Transcript_6824/g.15306  ORF Transcript_6824/g.15306 Transcript_6824/m.15306 type:complete len:268 (+) Transcript_6824:5729-6532(+)
MVHSKCQSSTISWIVYCGTSSRETPSSRLPMMSGLRLVMGRRRRCSWIPRKTCEWIRDQKSPRRRHRLPPRAGRLRHLRVGEFRRRVVLSEATTRMPGPRRQGISVRAHREWTREKRQQRESPSRQRRPEVQMQKESLVRGMRSRLLKGSLLIPACLCAGRSLQRWHPLVRRRKRLKNLTHHPPGRQMVRGKEVRLQQRLIRAAAHKPARPQALADQKLQQGQKQLPRRTAPTAGNLIVPQPQQMTSPGTNVRPASGHRAAKAQGGI